MAHMLMQLTTKQPLKIAKVSRQGLGKRFFEDGKQLEKKVKELGEKSQKKNEP